MSLGFLTGKADDFFLAIPADVPKTLTGRWKKDGTRSDKLDKGMDMIQLSWALKKGMIMVTALLVRT